MRLASFKNFLKSLGPGFIFAGAAIGVSHIVQSTRAGANYGFLLFGFIIIINIIKFPFFEFGPRYSAVTGKNLLHGYHQLGRGAVVAFLFFTLATMFIIQAALILVTASLSAQVFGESLTVFQYAVALSIFCGLILILGRYTTLDRLMKIMIILLSISTIVAVLMAFLKNPTYSAIPKTPSIWTASGMAFLVALTGWMPAPIEISVWHSTWSTERAKQTHHQPALKEAQWDFHIGYWGTMIMALLFLTLGALIMFPQGEVFSGSSIVFAKQFVDLYGNALGGWCTSIIAIVALVTMLSTSLACFDAFPRAVNNALTTLFPQFESKKFWVYVGTLIILAMMALLILGSFLNRLKALIDLATTLSFLAAPVMAFLNYKVVTSHFFPEHARPSACMRSFSRMGIVFLTLFAVIYIYWKFVLVG